eukprot:CAMPEP_0197445466 /NCGR_PEP_ID=MMETSP1175-20131217/10678_1 /TAXON_ID=1003142 /ORGANISM="Triceratium dubium, Strain CCMP147" /LENGTH=598 /DNA_ID=CAMNT_0042976429 /DNA_START=24 /DNA_END=1817 /DNA_ORIENTATION=+
MSADASRRLMLSPKEKESQQAVNNVGEDVDFGTAATTIAEVCSELPVGAAAGSQDDKHLQVGVGFWPNRNPQRPLKQQHQQKTPLGGASPPRDKDLLPHSSNKALLAATVPVSVKEEARQIKGDGDNKSCYPQQDDDKTAGCAHKGGSSIDQKEERTAGSATTDIKENNGFARTFPQRLMDVLNSGKHAEQAAVWMPDGLSFVIISPRTFMDQVLPMYFKQTKFASFTRKLNRWGFKRVTRGTNAGAYYHKLFQRDHPELAAQMFCTRTGPRRDERAIKAKQEANMVDMLCQHQMMMHMLAAQPQHSSIGQGGQFNPRMLSASAGSPPTMESSVMMKAPVMASPGQGFDIISNQAGMLGQQQMQPGAIYPNHGIGQQSSGFVPSMLSPQQKLAMVQQQTMLDAATTASTPLMTVNFAHGYGGGNTDENLGMPSPLQQQRQQEHQMQQDWAAAQQQQDNQCGEGGNSQHALPQQQDKQEEGHHDRQGNEKQELQPSTIFPLQQEEQQHDETQEHQESPQKQQLNQDSSGSSVALQSIMQRRTETLQMLIEEQKAQLAALRAQSNLLAKQKKKGGLLHPAAAEKDTPQQGVGGAAGPHEQ